MEPFNSSLREIDDPPELYLMVSIGLRFMTSNNWSSSKPQNLPGVSMRSLWGPCRRGALGSNGSPAVFLFDGQRRSSRFFKRFVVDFDVFCFVNVLGIADVGDTFRCNDITEKKVTDSRIKFAIKFIIVLQPERFIQN